MVVILYCCFEKLCFPVEGGVLNPNCEQVLTELSLFSSNEPVGLAVS